MSMSMRPRRPPVTYVVNYSFAEGDSFDFSALTSQFHPQHQRCADRARGGRPSGKFATLQVDTIDPNGLAVRPQLGRVRRSTAAHAGDAVSVTSTATRPFTSRSFTVGLPGLGAWRD